MAGRVLRVVPRQGTNYQGVAANSVLFLARRIDVSQFRDLTFFLRFHAGTNQAQAANALIFTVYADGFTEEDPGANSITVTSSPAFLSALALTGTTSVGNATAGQMFPLSITSGFGHLISIAWVANLAAAAAAYVFSVDMSGKE